MGSGGTTKEPIKPPPAALPMSGAAGGALAGIVAPVAGLLGAWTAAGSIGLVGHPLRHALTWLAMAVVIVASWPRSWRPWYCAVLWIAAIGAAVGMTTSTLVPINIMAVALLLAAAAKMRPDAERPLRAAAVAAATLGVYRLAITSIPTLWLAADHAGGALGRTAGWITGEALQVGATFGGLDFLVVMAALYVTWIIEMPQPRWHGAAWGVVGILVAQFCYLLILSEAPNLVDFLSSLVPPVAAAGSQPGEKVVAISLDDSLRRWVSECAPWKDLIPWNLPVLAALFQGLIATAMLFRLRAAGAARSPAQKNASARSESLLLVLTAGVLSAFVPVATVLAPYRATLEGKRIVAYEKGLLNWDKPVHGQYGRIMVGMYGMFDRFVESLGGSFKRSADLSEADLGKTDLLVLFYPTREFKDDQLQRVQKYVEHGGKLLLMCDHTGRETKHEGELEQFDLKESRFNELLKPTSIRVAFDAAEFAIGGWLESYEAVAHPTTLGIPDHRNVFGVVIGASLEIAAPARPILIGRWGYSDLGDEGSWPAMLGNHRYDPGEKLGDLVLAAEQPWGDGRVLVFGDTSSLNNGIVIGSHPFASRLLAYMAGDGSTANTPVRQTAGAILIVALIGLLCWRPSAWKTAIVAALLSMLLVICVTVTAAATELLPSGKRPTNDGAAEQAAKQIDNGSAAAKNPNGQQSPSTNNLAYIDFAHLGSFSEEATRPDGIFGFEYALMRDDYLVLCLYDLTYERLSRAGLFASLGPQRPFTPAERQAIRRFVEEGGIFILTAGYDRSSASRALLNDFKFTVGVPPPDLPDVTEPAPMGHFKAPYFAVRDDYEAFVRFHAAWPVACSDPDARPIAKGFADRPFDASAGGFRMEGKVELPVIIVLPVKQGKIVVIGDTDFATNKNLENEDGSPIEGLRENADFWRWLIPQLRGTTPWNPPKPEPQAPLPEVAPTASPSAAPTPAAAPTTPPDSNPKEKPSETKP